MPLPVAFVALAALQRIDARRPVDRRAVAPPRIDISDDFGAVFALGVEIGIEHAGFAGELQLTAIDFDHVEPGFAEQPLECADVLAHDRLKPARANSRAGGN